MNRLAALVSRFVVSSIVLVSLPVFAGTPDPRDIDAAIERAIDVFESPGMAVTVVHGSDIVYAGGRGNVEAGRGSKIDERTLFRIGSVSKAFTAATLAILAEEGRLDWEDRVIDHLPEFRMFDPWVTREFTIRDLLTHRSGLPLGAGDLLMFPDGNATVDDIIRAFRYLEPETSFRSEFAYDNLLYVVAGEVAARVAGQPFVEVLEERLLAPLGMNDCVASAERAGPGVTLATPHVLVENQLEETTTRISSVAAAAGGIACSARSMGKWMQFMLSGGNNARGERILGAAQFRELVRPVTVLPVAPYLAEHTGASLNAYALGWNISTFHGTPAWSHGGGVWGMTTFIVILPEKQLAVFASNNLMSVAPRAIVYDLVERGLAEAGQPIGNDWIDILAALTAERGDTARAAVAAAREARDADSRPSLPLAEYAGRYRDDWYGDIVISVNEDDGLYFRSERNEPLEGRLEHFQHDTFIARWSDRRLDADAYVSFRLGPDGSVESIDMQAVSPATDFSFDFHHLDLLPVRGE